MNLLRKVLFPFAILYGFVTSIRNFLYDNKIFKSYSFDVPIIAVGNLSAGGTGKTPQIEYLVRLLSKQYQVATLSRGYKRKSEGFILANNSCNAEILGDEPYLFYKKFPAIQVAVDANRKNGIEQLLLTSSKPQVILLDDAFQHRKVKAGLYILLTAYNDLFYNDFMLPTGNLRESRNGIKRADMIIVTKCPKDITELAQNKIKQQIGINKAIYFTYIDYDDKVYSDEKTLYVKEIINNNKLLVAGIAKPEPFFEYLQSKNNECLIYPDHHHFLEKDIIRIKEKATNKIIITTEKDFVRLEKKLNSKDFYYLPIRSSFVKDSTNFNQKILNYVGTSTRNS